MSFKFEYVVSQDDNDDIHDLDCEDNMYEECTCDYSSKKITISFKTTCGPNLEYAFESNITFFANKYDKNNLKKFVKILQNPLKINNIVNKAKTSVNQVYIDRTDLVKNRRLYFNSRNNTLSLNFITSRYNHNTIEFDLENEEIGFHTEVLQRCGQYCSCGDCEYYGRFDTSQDINIPFKLETQTEIIQAFNSVLEILSDIDV